MASLVLEIADAVVDALNAATLPVTATAERSFRPVNELPDLVTEAKLFVSPRGMELVTDQRGEPQKLITIDVGLQKKFAEISEIEDLLDAIEAISLLFHGKVISTDSGRGMCTEASPDPIYDAASIEQRRLFAGVVVLTFEFYSNA